jgi:ribonucleotide reductase alpha subunit
MKVADKTVERPQHLFMRVALAIHEDNLEKVQETYDALSQKHLIHASPTLFNAGTDHATLLSCFLLGIDDSIQGIYKNLSDCAMISKGAGGIGVHISNIRAKNSIIQSTNGLSNGIIPMLKLYNDTAKYVTQSGKRNGSIAIYLEPHHPEIFDFLLLRKNSGVEEERCRDLFTAVWLSDLFMERVKKDKPWTLFSEDTAKGLSDVYGDEYRKLYKKYEEEGLGIRTVMARDIWKAILTSTIETGTPYVGFKDTVNRRSNQKNLGTIKSSNLCVAPETLILTSNGYQEIQYLKDKKIKIWNGLEWSDTEVKQTGENQELITVEFSNGSKLDCTKYHKFYIQNNNQQITVEAKDLIVGMKLIDYQLPNDNQIYQVEITNITDNNRTDDTYCFNEPNRHTGIFNGIIAGNCIEINEYSDDKEYACCTLASISLPAFVENGEYNYHKLGQAVRVAVRNLNVIIDTNQYPVPETKRSNENHRPLGIGIQGLADVFMKMNLEFTSTKAKEVNKNISETMYYHALDESSRIAKERSEMILECLEMLKEGTYKGISDNYNVNSVIIRQLWDSMVNKRVDKRIIGTLTDKEIQNILCFYYVHKEKMDEIENTTLGSYSSFENSPISKGQFQFNLAGFTSENESNILSGMWDFTELRERIKKWGVRNSLLLALMPTASTSNILGNTECFEPITSNMYLRRTLAGEFVIINQYLITDLINLGLWNAEMKNKIMSNYGSIMNIPEIPVELKEKYLTVWEIPKKPIIEMARDRGYFTCQAQSMNLYFEQPDMNKINSALIYGWEQGLKTGIYYTRIKPSVEAIQFTVEPAKMQKEVKTQEDCLYCSA